MEDSIEGAFWIAKDLRRGWKGRNPHLRRSKPAQPELATQKKSRLWSGIRNNINLVSGRGRHVGEHIHHLANLNATHFEQGFFFIVKFEFDYFLDAIFT